MTLLPTVTDTGGFAGFNMCAAHSEFLKFWYYPGNGLLYAEADEDGPHGYFTGFMEKAIMSIETASPSMQPWMNWLRSTLDKVILLLHAYTHQVISSYRVEDRNRVTLLAWETILRNIDAIGPTIIPEWDMNLMMEFRLVYVKYHTNISYVHRVDNIFMSDLTITQHIGGFEQPPPDLSNTTSHITPSIVPLVGSQYAPQYGAFSASASTTGSSSYSMGPYDSTSQKEARAKAQALSEAAVIQQLLREMRTEINALRLEVKQKDQLLQRPQRIVDDTTFMVDDNDYKGDDDSDDDTYPSHQQVGRSMTRISSSNTRDPSPRFRPYESNYDAPRLSLDHHSRYHSEPRPVPLPAVSHAPVHSSPPIPRTLNDDEKKRRVQRALLPSPPPYDSDEIPELMSDDEEASRPLLPSNSSSHQPTSSPQPTDQPPIPLRPMRKGEAEEQQILLSTLQESIDTSRPRSDIEQRLLDAEEEIRQLRAAAIQNSIPTTASTMMDAIPIAYPADKLTTFDQNLKNDSQLQAFVSSQSSYVSYPVEPAVASVVPTSSNPIATVSQQVTVPIPTARQRVQPVLINVNSADKKRHFPAKVHSYFVNDDYAPDMPQYERDFLNDCIIHHCCQGDKVIKIPPISEAALIGFKDYQSTNLIHHLDQSYIASSFMLEILCMYMENIFLIQRSTIATWQVITIRSTASVPWHHHGINRSTSKSTCRE